jgi:dolichyl-phosphate-mannose--protein O-mannosyl transferase
MASKGILESMKRRVPPEFIALFVGAALTRFIGLFRPGDTVFDEVYFKAFAAHYLDGHYFFDIHPPLMKLILAGWAKLWHLDAATLLMTPALPLRLIPALAGTLLVPLVWLILRRLGVGRIFAFLGAFMVLADGALLVESRFILTDSLLLVCGLGAFYAFLETRHRQGWPRRWWLLAAACAAGAAGSIKWTGLTALAIIGLGWLWDQRHNLQQAKNLSNLFQDLAALAFIPLLIYLGCFWLHFKLLPATGDGDAFMSQQFQSTLIGNASYDPYARMGFFAKVTELNITMYRANRDLTATHPYGSRWATWPFLERPIYYWQGTADASGKQGNIYLLGNPIVWWGVVVSAMAILAYILINNHKLPRRLSQLVTLLVIGYLLNLLPFIGVPRVMFLYHYFFSFLYSILIVCLLGDYLLAPHLAKKKVRWIFVGIIATIAGGFIYFSPLYYGLPLTTAQLQEHMWLPTWR